MKIQGRQLTSGFGLKELLITVSVVAVLAVLAFAFLRKSKTASTSDVCTSNLKQLYTAAALYTAQNGNKLPYAIRTVDDSKQTSWDILISSYLRSTMNTDSNRPPPSASIANKVLLCPFDKMEGVFWGGKVQPRRTYAMTPHTMATNQWPPSPTNATGLGLVWSPRRTGPGSITNKFANGLPAFRVDTLLETKNIIFLTEQAKTNNVLNNSSGAIVNYTGNHLDASIAPKDYHEGKINYLMADGHVEMLLPEQTVGATGEVGTKAEKHFGLWTVRPGD